MAQCSTPPPRNRLSISSFIIIGSDTIRTKKEGIGSSDLMPPPLCFSQLTSPHPLLPPAIKGMGNCQVTTEAATVAIQRPGGRVERLYWPTSASELMKNHPGHHVALVTLYDAEEKNRDSGTVRLTRVRLLKPGDTLLLGQVYRLVTYQEVMKAIQARKIEKMKKREAELMERQKQILGVEEQSLELLKDGRGYDSENTVQVEKQKKASAKRNSEQSMDRPPRQWRPSLQSIEEWGAS